MNKNYYYALIEISKIYYKLDRLDKAILVAQEAKHLIKKLKKDFYTKEDLNFLLFLANLYIKKGTQRYLKKANDLVTEICKYDPKNMDALNLYEELNGKVFRLYEVEE